MTYSTWGPPVEVPPTLRFSDSPYSPFSKGDKLGKIADWAQDPAIKDREARRSHYPGTRSFREPYHAYGASSSSFFATETPENSLNFSIVDKHAAKQTKAVTAVLKRRGNTFAPRAQARVNEASQQPQKGRTRPPWQVERRHREPSVAIGSDWTLIQTNQFSELSKLQLTPPSLKTVYAAGRVHQFDKSSEGAKEPRKLPEAQGAVYAITTSDDPVVELLAEEPRKTQTRVFATDKILALLMCASRTNLPWEVIINKHNGDIYFDKRDDGPLDFLTVDENSSNIPSETAELKINTPRDLAIEATYLNTKFTSAAITNKYTALEHSNPYAEDDEVLPKGYIYSETPLDTDTSLFVRSEVDAVNEDGSYDIVRALNEYQALEWRDGWANRRGAIIANEMRNNLAKLAQWTAQAYIAGAKYIKLGFVSRTNPKDRTQHELIGVQSRDPATLSKELNFNLENGWGIVASLVDIFKANPDGRYVLLRDPNAPAVKIYRVPDDAVIE